MNDEQRKILTKFLGECWHEIEETFPLYPPGTKYCESCEEYVDDLATNHQNRTFTTWQDLGDLKDKLVEKGLWANFYNKTWSHHEHAITESEHVACLFRPIVDGEPHFARLVAEFLEGRK